MSLQPGAHSFKIPIKEVFDATLPGKLATCIKTCKCFFGKTCTTKIAVSCNAASCAVCFRHLCAAEQQKSQQSQAGQSEEVTDDTGSRQQSAQRIRRLRKEPKPMPSSASARRGSVTSIACQRLPPSTSCQSPAFLHCRSPGVPPVSFGLGFRF